MAYGKPSKYPEQLQYAQVLVERATRYRQSRISSWQKEPMFCCHQPVSKPGKSQTSNLYEKLYCIRGEMENRIKQQQLGLFADRTATQSSIGRAGAWFLLMMPATPMILLGCELSASIYQIAETT